MLLNLRPKVKARYRNINIAEQRVFFLKQAKTNSYHAHLTEENAKENTFPVHIYQCLMTTLVHIFGH